MDSNGQRVRAAGCCGRRVGSGGRLLVTMLLLGALVGGQSVTCGQPTSPSASAALAAPEARQNPLAGLSQMSEGQALMMKQSRESILKAIVKFQEGFAQFQQNDNQGGMAGARFWEGIAYDSLGKSQQALPLFLEAERLLEQTVTSFLLPLVQVIIGATYASLGETKKALEYLNRALPSLQHTKRPDLLSYAFKGLGEVHMQSGQKRQGLAYLNQALGYYQQLGDWRHEIQLLTLISVNHSCLGQATEALRLARVAVERAKEQGAADAEAYAYFAVGAAYASVDKLQEATAAYQQALHLLRGQNDPSGETLAHNNLGLIAVSRGELELAKTYLAKAMELTKASNDLRSLGYALNHLGVIHFYRGEPLQALRHYEEALGIAHKHKDKRLQATVLFGLADGNFLSRNYAHSLRLLEEAAAALEEPILEVSARINLADIHSALKEYQKALDILKPLVESTDLERDPVRYAYVLRELGFIYSSMGDQEQALSTYEKALTRLQTAEDGVGMAELYAAMAAAYLSRNDYQKAEETFAKGLERAQASGLRQGEIVNAVGLGAVQARQGNWAQAESYYQQALTASEAYRSSARLKEFKTGVSGLYAKLYAPAVLLKIKLGKSAEAFDLTERARARTFLDQLNNARLDFRQGASRELIAREQELNFELRRLEEKLKEAQRHDPASESSRIIAASLQEKEGIYADLLIRLKVSNPDYAELKSHSPQPLAQLQRLLGSQTTLLSYYVTAENQTLAFVVSAETLKVVELPVGDADLRAAINWFRSFPSLRESHPQSLKQLYDWLLEPVREYLKTKEVIVVPHGILHYVPFAALHDGHRYFGDEQYLYYLPSASILSSLRQRARPRRRGGLAIAQSQAQGRQPLRYADAEAGGVAKLYGARLLGTGSATRQAFVKQAGAQAVLHIAAHAKLNGDSPLFSRILLAPAPEDGGALEMREIYGLDLSRTEMVVLSACQSQLGAHSQGDDVVGLNRAFLAAGAASVIASLWTVDDQATGLLMTSFYSYWKQGMSKAAALRAAQMTTRKRYPHPYYWAAFVLTGDPGKPPSPPSQKPRR